MFALAAHSDCAASVKPMVMLTMYASYIASLAVQEIQEQISCLLHYPERGDVVAVGGGSCTLHVLSPLDAAPGAEWRLASRMKIATAGAVEGGGGGGVGLQVRTGIGRWGSDRGD
jgi:hypothetical protein